MDEIDVAYLLTLPLELQCMILGRSISLKEITLIRESSKELENILFSCLEEVVSDGDEGTFFPALVMDMKRIKVIPPEYPIYITKKHQLLRIAKHPTLQEASFDLSGLFNKFVDIVDLVLSFFSEYQTYGNTCRDCQGRYNFTFFFRRETTYFIIQVTEGSLTFHNMGHIYRISSLYKNLVTKVPICEFTGSLDTSLSGVAELPCLTTISLRYNHNIAVKLADLPFWFYTNVMNDKIEKYNISSPKILYHPYAIGFLSTFISRLINHLDIKKINYPKVTTFFPVICILEDIQMTRKVFPNLTSICFDFPSIRRLGQIPNIIIQEIKDLDEIVLFNNLNEPLNKQRYIDLFPPELHDKITFVESDWLL